MEYFHELLQRNYQCFHIKKEFLLVLEIWQKYGLAYPCIEMGKWRTFEAHYSATTGQFPSLPPPTLSLIDANVDQAENVRISKKGSSSVFKKSMSILHEILNFREKPRKPKIQFMGISRSYIIRE
ncbi:hypothetical protein T12_3423 [Trichinella patagoniensis]|uniref:Uncharacterized protein n=1 Tax=Trichinella patagoniensis TaxID=990121 RepID=A0A0V0ZSN8_9BILA|nr:hypothetical protein T12_3423 [Trichinella patagoniensis]